MLAPAPPAIINTSFNMHEEPVICSPDDAVRAFLLDNIDYLAIGPFLAPYPRLRENTKERQRCRRGSQPVSCSGAC
jgi:carbamoyltransferase